MTTRFSLALLAASLLVVSVLGGCDDDDDGNGGNSGGALATTESEGATATGGNDTSANAESLNVGEAGVGSLQAVDDIDFWSITLEADTFYRLSVFAARFDHAAWDTSGNLADAILYASDGTTIVRWTDQDSFFGGADVDMEGFQVDAAGTYFIAVQVYQEYGATTAGARYAILVDTITEMLGLDLSATPQVEQEELVGNTATNDSFATAEAITSDLIKGYRTDNNDDFYELTLTTDSIVDGQLNGHRVRTEADDTDNYDPVIFLYNDAQSTIFVNDDRIFYDSGFRRFLPAGTYYIRVTECCGSGDTQYFLNVRVLTTSTAAGDVEPNDDAMTATAITFGTVYEGDSMGSDDFYSLAADAGDWIAVDAYHATDWTTFPLLGNFEGPNGAVRRGSYDGVFFFFAPVAGTYTFSVESSPSARAYRLRATRFMTGAAEASDATNGTTAGAEAFPDGGMLLGQYDTANDVDTFSFTANADELAVFSVSASGGANYSGGFGAWIYPSSVAIESLRILDSDGNEIAASFLSGPNTSFSTEASADALAQVSVAFVAPSDGTYFVEVTHNDGLGDAYALYRAR